MKLSARREKERLLQGEKDHLELKIKEQNQRAALLEDLERNLIISKKLGYEGMMILNPKELALCHKYYSPSEEQVEWAEEILELAVEAQKEGKGVAIKGNKFIGPPMVKMAKDILAKNELIRMKNISF